MTSGIRARFSSARVVQVSGKYLETPYASVQLMLVAGVGLLFFGLIMSASTTVSAALHTTDATIWSQLTKEAMFLALSLPVFWLAVRLPPQVYRKFAYPAVFLAVAMLIGVLIPHIGATINGAHRWILIGPLTIQPSEFAKIAFLLWGADLLARKEQLKTLTTLRHVLVPLVPGFMLVIGLVMLEPDLGTSLCFFLLLLGLLWVVGLPLRYFLTVFGVVAFAVTVLAVAEPYRLQRLTTFMHPFADQQGAGFHTVQGLYALASGGLFGVGLGQGTSKFGWVPNANTDYVFAIVGEELGLLGCLVVLALFALFTYSAIRIAARSNDAFIRYVASGAAVWIAGQALINIGYVTALLPVTGIPLPFISNGGTSLVLTCGVLGMLVSFARHEPAAVKAAQRASNKGTTAKWITRLRLGTPVLPAKTVRRDRPARTARQQSATSGRASGRTARPASQATGTAVRPARVASRDRAVQAPSRVRVAPPPLRPTGTDPGRSR